MKRIFEAINIFLLPVSVCGMIGVIVLMNRLPGQIAEAVYLYTPQGKGDTVVKEKIVTVSPAVKGGLSFIKGEMTGESQLLSDAFGYVSEYPLELYDGYITPLRANNGAKYYVWSKLKVPVPESGIDTQGWFISIGGNWQMDKDYVPIVIPVMSKNKNEL